jgi:WD40 repeat protein
MSLGDIILKFCPGESPIISADVSPDSKVLAVAQISGLDKCPTLSLSDLETGKTNRVIEKSVGGKNSVWKVKFDKTGSKLTYIFQYVGKFSLIMYDLIKNKRETIKEVERQLEFNGYAINPLDGTLVIPTKKNSLEFWELEAKRIANKVKLKESLNPVSIDASIIISFSPDGKYLAIGGMEDGNVFLYNTENYELIRKLRAPFKFPRQVLFDNKSELIVAVDFWQKGVFIWDVQSGERYLEEAFDEHRLKVICSSVSPDSNYIALGYSTSRFVMFDLKTGDSLFRDKLHEARIYDICITPDGKKLITAGEDWQVVVRSME